MAKRYRFVYAVNVDGRHHAGGAVVGEHELPAGVLQGLLRCKHVVEAPADEPAVEPAVEPADEPPAAARRKAKARHKAKGRRDAEAPADDEPADEPADEPDSDAGDQASAVEQPGYDAGPDTPEAGQE